MHSLINLSVLVLLAIWFALSVAFNVPKCKPLLAELDHLSLLPAWSFFAPTPGTRDYHWLFRDRLSNGTLMPWTEITAIESRSVWTSIINPNKRGTKTLLDIAGELTSPSLNEKGIKTAMISLSYLVLLQAVSSTRHTLNSRQTQFMVMASQGKAEYVPPSVVFISDFHEL